MKDYQQQSVLSPINSSWSLITKRQEESLQALENYLTHQSKGSLRGFLKNYIEPNKSENTAHQNV